MDNDLERDFLEERTVEAQSREELSDNDHTPSCPVTDGHMYCECKTAEQMEATN